MNPIRPDEWELLNPIIGTTMLELGNKFNTTVKRSYKDYLVTLGIDHTSIDWNGLDGALKLDLREPLWDRFAPFDIVTNFGTTEHVSNQQAVWQNVHNLIKVGGYLISQTPYEGSWKNHGEWYPKETFFEQLASNGYEIERLYQGREFPTVNLYARLKKVEDKPFVMPDKGTIYNNVH